MHIVRRVAALLALVPLIATAQSSNPAQAQVIAAEAAFWQAYNACDYAELDKRIANDVEFYHDVGGLTLGRAALVNNLRKSICGNPQLKLRRELKPDDMRVDILKESGKVYAVLTTGTHYFHEKRGTSVEELTGRARFAQLWVPRKGQWELKRVFSFDHQPFGAASTIAAAAAPLTAAQIDNYVGTFIGQGLPPLVFTRANDRLVVKFEEKNLVLHPLAKANFFLIKENNAEVEFNGGDTGPARSLVVRMNGKQIGAASRK